MSTISTAMQRCPRCGNENRGTNFACTFCGKRLRIESVEKLFIFRRIEEEWAAPYSFFRKIYYLFVNSPRAFWDINHARKKSPGTKIFFLITLIYGFMGFALFSHFKIDVPNLHPLVNQLLPPWIGFVSFFLFGLIYHYLFFRILIWLFTKGANYAVGYSERLESRFGKDKEDAEKYSEAHMSPFSIYKGGVLQQQQAHKKKMMFCAFTPFMLIYLIEMIIIFIAFPGNILMNEAGFEFLFGDADNKTVWAVLYALEALVIMLWLPTLMAIAIRELSNSSTFRLLIPSYIIGIAVAVLFYFFRPPFITL